MTCEQYILMVEGSPASSAVPARVSNAVHQVQDSFRKIDAHRPLEAYGGEVGLLQPALDAAARAERRNQILRVVVRESFDDPSMEL